MGYSTPSLVNLKSFWPPKKRHKIKIRYSQNSKISVWKLNFFSWQAIAKIIFVLEYSYTWNTPRRVRSNWTKFLTLWEKKLLLKIVILNTCKFPYENLIFFLASYSEVFFRFSL